MTSTNQTWHRYLIGIIVAVLLSMLGLAGGGQPARAADGASDGSGISLLINGFSPAIPTEGSILSLNGIVDNYSNEELTNVSLNLRITSWVMESREDIAQTQAGNPIDNIALDGSERAITALLGVGARSAWQVGIPMSTLPLPTVGVYGLGVEVHGTRSDGTTADTTAWTFLTWVPDQTQVSTTKLVWLWPVASFPAQDSEGIFLGPRPATQFALSGRLNRLATMAAGRPVGWIIDPQVLQAARQMSGAYRIYLDNTVKVGTHSADAAAWLKTLEKSAVVTPTPKPHSNTGPAPTPAPTPASIRVLPYSNVDTTALNRAGMTADAVLAVSTAAPIATAVLGRPTSGSILWAPDGSFDDASLALASTTGTSAVVMSDTAMPPDPAVDFTPSGMTTLQAGGRNLRALLIDSGLSAPLNQSIMNAADVIAARQRFLAETTMISMEIPDQSRTIVMGPASTLWDPSDDLVRSLFSAIDAAPWLQLTSLDSALGAEASSVPRSSPTYNESNMAREVQQTYLHDVHSTQIQTSILGSVIANPANVTNPIDEALIRAESSAWRIDPGLGVTLLSRVTAVVKDQTDGVQIVSRGTITMAGETGIVPVTIANSLDRDVTVNVKLIGTPSARLVSESLSDVTIPAGRKLSIELPARVIGSGPLPVSVQMTTNDGRDFGEATPLQLQSTAYTRAAGWVVLTAFCALAVFVVFGIARRIRNARRASRLEP